MAKRQYNKAAELIGTVIKNSRARADDKKYLLSSLIMNLQFPGILYYSMGQHEDGVLVAAEIDKLKTNLDRFPIC